MIAFGIKYSIVWDVEALWFLRRKLIRWHNTMILMCALKYKTETLECDFILRDREANYAYLQIAYTIALSQETEEREYRTLEKIRDNYPKYLLTTDYLLQKRGGIRHVNIMEFMQSGSEFA